MGETERALGGGGGGPRKFFRGSNRTPRNVSIAFKSHPPPEGNPEYTPDRAA